MNLINTLQFILIIQLISAQITIDLSEKYLLNSQQQIQNTIYIANATINSTGVPQPLIFDSTASKGWKIDATSTGTVAQKGLFNQLSIATGKDLQYKLTIQNIDYSSIQLATGAATITPVDIYSQSIKSGIPLAISDSNFLYQIRDKHLWRPGFSFYFNNKINILSLGKAQGYFTSDQPFKALCYKYNSQSALRPFTTTNGDISGMWTVFLNQINIGNQGNIRTQKWLTYAVLDTSTYFIHVNSDQYTWIKQSLVTITNVNFITAEEIDCDPVTKPSISFQFSNITKGNTPRPSSLSQPLTLKYEDLYQKQANGKCIFIFKDQGPNPTTPPPNGGTHTPQNIQAVRLGYGFLKAVYAWAQQGEYPSVTFSNTFKFENQPMLLDENKRNIFIGSSIFIILSSILIILGTLRKVPYDPVQQNELLLSNRQQPFQQQQIFQSQISLQQQAFGRPMSPNTIPSQLYTNY